MSVTIQATDLQKAKLCLICVLAKYCMAHQPSFVKQLGCCIYFVLALKIPSFSLLCQKELGNGMLR